MGIVETAQAKEIAQEKNLDLVMIAPKANPPVCKIISYKKYCYEQKKKDRESRKNQKTMAVKEVRVSLSISEHDLGVKLKRASEFLNDVNKVKLSIKFRGRELARMDTAHALVRKIVDTLGDSCLIEKPATFENRNMFVMFIPNTKG